MDRNDTAPPVATTDRAPADTYDRANVEVGQNTLPVRNRVQWGPIIAGVVTTAVTMIVLSLLGLALGASVLGRNAEGGEIGTWAAIWGIVSAIIAFFIGGWIAARSAAVGGSGSGMLNGLMAGCATFILLLWLTGLGLGNAFGVAGANFDDLVNSAQDQADVTTTSGAVDQAQNTLRASYSDVENSSWWTLVGILVGLGAATIGGAVGHNSRSDLVEGSAV